MEYRRRLPHFHPDATYLFLTWRLWGTLPPTPDPVLYPTAGQKFLAQDRALDHCPGPRWLAEQQIADLVADAILCGDTGRHFYELLAWVVMPNHVHLLVLPEVAVPEITSWLKGSTARRANMILERTGEPFWQDESYDHYLRNPEQIGSTISYIERNPVSARLALSPEQWRWSSAHGQAKAPAPPRQPNQPISPTQNTQA